MVFLHIIPPSKRMMNSFISEIRNRFRQDDHIFYFINHCPASEKSLFDFGNVYEMNGDTRFKKAMHLKSMIDKCDYVIWHGMTYPIRHVFFACQKSILKKSIWLMWGIDLYNWELPNNNYKNRLKNKLNSYWRNNVPIIISLLEADEEYYHNKFPNSKAKFYNIPYPIGIESFDIMDKLSHWKPRQNGKICIQVAHNAHPFNNHAEILDMISKYKDENVSIYIPLSYGSDTESGKKYKNRVIEKTVSLFPNKSFCLHKLIPLNKYMRFLWNMDISVFYAHRQNALGNICRQLYMGNKIFLSPQSPTYAFLKEKGIEVFNTEDIPQMSFEEFSKPSCNTVAKEWVYKTYHPDNVFSLWSDMIVELGGNPQEKDDDILQLRKQINEPNYLYKDNFPLVFKYLKWNTDVSKSQPTVIVGSGIIAQKLVAELDAYNKAAKRHVYHLVGFTKTEYEQYRIVPKLDLGDYDKFNFQNDYSVFCTALKGEDREQAITLLEQNDQTPKSWTKATNKYSILGIGCIFIGNCSIGSQSSLCDGVLLYNSTIGMFCDIGNFVTLTNAYLGNFTKIEDYTTIGYGSKIYSSRIGKHSQISNSVNISQNTVIGNSVIISDNVQIGNKLFDAIGVSSQSILINDNVEIHSSVYIDDNCTIGRNSIIDENSKIGKNVTIEENCIIGRNVTIGDNSVIPANSIIDNFSQIN